MIVDLPAPDGPTSAVTLPGSARSETPCSTRSPSRYAKPTSSNTTSPPQRAQGHRPPRVLVLRPLASTSRVRSRPAKASVSWVPIVTIWKNGPTRKPRNTV